MKDLTDEVLELFRDNSGTMTIPRFRQLWAKKTGRHVSHQVATRRFTKLVAERRISRAGKEATGKRGAAPDIYLLKGQKKPCPTIKTTDQARRERKVKAGSRWCSKGNPDRVVQVTDTLKIDGRPCVKLGTRIIFVETLLRTYRPVEDKHDPDQDGPA